jgi:DNA-binding CsgD family transcriptional regulator
VQPWLSHAAFSPADGKDRARPQRGWGSLTPAEREVVEPVTIGLSNAEIGE